jgi:hypothetical protein
MATSHQNNSPKREAETHRQPLSPESPAQKPLGQIIFESSVRVPDFLLCAADWVECLVGSYVAACQQLAYVDPCFINGSQPYNPDVAYYWPDGRLGEAMNNFESYLREILASVRYRNPALFADNHEDNAINYREAASTIADHDLGDRIKQINADAASSDEAEGQYAEHLDELATHLQNYRFNPEASQFYLSEWKADFRGIAQLCEQAYKRNPPTATVNPRTVTRLYKNVLRELGIWADNLSTPANTDKPRSQAVRTAHATLEHGLVTCRRNVPAAILAYLTETFFPTNDTIVYAAMIGNKTRPHDTYNSP